jgi:hypothetical protein
LNEWEENNTGDSTVAVETDVIVEIGAVVDYDYTGEVLLSIE